MTSSEPTVDWDEFERPLDPAWTEPTEDQVQDFHGRLEDVVSTLARSISVRDQQMGAGHPHLNQVEFTPDYKLAMVRALREARDAAEELSEKYVRGAGAGGINYPQLGAAWGISRQAARKRWPGAVAVNGYANREPIHFEAFGGEARVVWHPEEGSWWWIATAANRKTQEAPDDVMYDTSEEAAAAAGAFLATNTTTGANA
ncbi:hypothetical protein AB0G85_33140 [Streptomyces sioyaensis]|uniref:hypothetical protein n=1 Tax=Streptomyces sioyaensis TaxID=67364 RepID=UPI0033DAEDEC